MADTGSSIFNKNARERLRSPDDLDKFVQVTNPSVWMVLIACTALLIGLLTWGVFGTVSTNVSATATQISGRRLCLIDPNERARIKVGDPAVVAGRKTTVMTVSEIPISRSEARDLLENDWLVSSLMKGDWAYVVFFEYEDQEPLLEGTPLEATITTERVAPISLVLGED